MQQQLRDQLIKQARLAAVVSAINRNYKGRSGPGQLYRPHPDHRGCQPGSRVMTTETPPSPPPPLSAGQAAGLLDHVVYQQVLACIDLDALYDLEQSLTMLAGDLDGVSPDHAADLAKAMLDRALLRLPDDMRRYLHAARWPFEGCELCEEEARQAGRGGEHHASRPRS